MQAAALVERSDHQGPAGSGVSYWQVRVGAWVNLPGRAFKCLGSPESARALLRVSGLLGRHRTSICLGSPDVASVSRRLTGLRLA